MSRNFGIGSRALCRAGIMVLRASDASFASIATNASRWRHFTRWAREHGVNRMEQIDAAHLILYGKSLADQVRDGTLGLCTAHNNISAVNRIVELARRDRKVRVSAVKQCDLPRRNGIARASKAIPKDEHQLLRYQLPGPAAKVQVLAEAIGTRAKEAFLLDANQALEMARTLGRILIERGTKGGQPRWVPITSEEQIIVLETVARAQKGRCMVPPGMTYAEFRRKCYRVYSKYNRARHSYAQGRYEILTTAQCPVAAGCRHGLDHYRYLAEKLGLTIKEARAIDARARQQIAEELGHHRRAITNAYLG